MVVFYAVQGVISCSVAAKTGEVVDFESSLTDGLTHGANSDSKK